MSILAPPDTMTPAPGGLDEPTRRRSRRPAVALFIALMTGYFTAGALMVLRYDFYEPDAFSRVANAAYTLMSRDPHLGAVGFVWNPLPSLVQIPLLPLSHWWPEIRNDGLAGILQSAAFMAGAVVLVRRIALDRGVGSLWLWIAVGCFALNPIIIAYGASGMSEAAMLFCLLWCVRRLLLWIETRYVGDLAIAGIALGVGYLTRYEMIPAAFGAAVLVGAIAYRRAPQHSRKSFAFSSMMIVLMPIVMAVGLWAATSWIVTGEMFATVSSQYGNASQVHTAVERGGIITNANWYVIGQRMLGMQPFVGLAVTLAVAVAALKRRVDVLAPLATFGAVLAFAAWGHFTVSTFGWFRFYMPAIPLVIVVVLVCWTPITGAPGSLRLDSVPARLAAGLLCLSVVVGMPVTAYAMLDRGNTTNQPLLLGLNSLIDPRQYPPEEYRRMTASDQILADWLDRQNLPAGSVLTDTFISSPVWLASGNPAQFVVTSDYDFTAALNRPWDFGVRYILVSNPAGNAAKDAITQRYPSIWDDGAGLGRLVHVAGPAGQEWRLYRVEEPTDELAESEIPSGETPMVRPGG
ncbi:ArnT family glycosyltransferase [Mycolicibacterium mengxianglii]|uniref:ArnT family glycosyltransferase n=1 Tax=Mycolicibacterium mengxianglii TaxID=2736649 RepID=UPI0027DA2B60|nr:glycosyltransferase family 39 protein [Mycolicibacterium mengxianglii]